MNSRELTFTFAVIVRPSVVRRLSVTFVHPTQAIEIFRDVSTPFGTLEAKALRFPVIRLSVRCPCVR